MALLSRAYNKDAGWRAAGDFLLSRTAMFLNTSDWSRRLSKHDGKLHSFPLDGYRRSRCLLSGKAVALLLVCVGARAPSMDSERAHAVCAFRTPL